MAAGVIAVALLWIVVGYAIKRMFLSEPRPTDAPRKWSNASYAIAQTLPVALVLSFAAVAGDWAVAPLFLPFAAFGFFYIDARSRGIPEPAVYTSGRSNAVEAARTPRGRVWAIVVVAVAVAVRFVVPSDTGLILFGIGFCAAGLWFFAHPVEFARNAATGEVNRGHRWDASIQRPLAVIAVTGGLFLVAIGIVETIA